MAQVPRGFKDRLPVVIKYATNALKLHTQQITNLQSGVSALRPGSWELLTLEAGWSAISGYIPPQVRIQQAGQSMLVGHIQGGATASGTVVATLTAGYFNAVHNHSFTANVLSGAAAVSVNGTVSGSSDTGSLANGTISGATDSDGLADGTIGGASASASGAGSHVHGNGSFAVNNGHHTHAGNTGAGSLSVTDGRHGHGSSALVPATPVNYNTVVLTLNTSGQLILTNCSSSAAELSFNEQLPLITS